MSSLCVHNKLKCNWKPLSLQFRVEPSETGLEHTEARTISVSNLIKIVSWWKCFGLFFVGCTSFIGVFFRGLSVTFSCASLPFQTPETQTPWAWTALKKTGWNRCYREPWRAWTRLCWRWLELLSMARKISSSRTLRRWPRAAAQVWDAKH